MYSFVVPLSLLCGYIFFCRKGVIIQTLRSPQPPLKRGENSFKLPLLKGDLGGSSSLKCHHDNEKGENPFKLPLLKGDLGGSSSLKCHHEKFENTP
jgi:hypothetical protein